MTNKHIPVLREQILNHFSLSNQQIFVDCTFGRGGHSLAMIEKYNCNVIAIDRDPTAIHFGKKLTRRYPNNLQLFQSSFSEIRSILQKANIKKVDAILLDLGVSSPQLDDPLRGFSFQKNGPLDMRMSTEGQTAADIINTYEEDKLNYIFRTYGEEKQSRRIARKIVKERENKPFTTTLELSDLIQSIIPAHKQKIHPATRVFQALRIEVNEELKELETFLEQCLSILNNGGKLGIISFHSLEDRIVKKFFSAHNIKQPNINRHLPSVQPLDKELYFSGGNKVIKPSEQEILENVRARSSKLRIGEFIHGINPHMEDK